MTESFRTAIAIAHALKAVLVPQGHTLWIYGDTRVVKGDVYSPWQDAAHKSRTDDIRFHASGQTLAAQYDAVIVNSPKQQEEAEGLVALALHHSKGFVMLVAAKDAGGGRLATMMEQYGIPFGALSKDGCRVVWTSDASKAKPELIAKNIANLDLRQITLDEENWWTVPGVFGWNKIDAGSRLLIEHLPEDIHGRVADFGCGYGYLAVQLSRRYPLIDRIEAFDADARAVAATQRNGDQKIEAAWMDVTGLQSQQKYDAVIMNPPFHSGKTADSELGGAFILSGWKNLKSGGRLFFVANKHLPYEKVVPGLSNLYEGDGFKIITGTKP